MNTLIPIVLILFLSVPSAWSQDKPAAKEPARTEAVLIVKVKDPGVTVTLDGKTIGKTPLPGPWTLKPGAHVVAFESTGQARGEVRFVVNPGESKTVQWPEAAASTEEVGGGLNWAPWSLSDVGLAVTVGGVAAMALGGYFGSQAVEIADEAGKMVTTETLRADFERLTEQSSDAALAANLSYGIGAAAVMSGLVMAIFGDGGLMSIQGDEEEAVIIIGGNF